jgi:integrase
MSRRHLGLLTVHRVEKLVGKGTPGRHFDGEGLYLHIKSPNAASWSRRYERDGKAHELGIGPFKLLSLAEARERNRAISLLLLDGHDPIAARKAKRAELAASAARLITFKECAEAYIAANRAQWRSADHGRQWLSSLARFVYPLIGGINVGAVGVPEVLKVLEQSVPARAGFPAGKFWTVRPETADRVRGRLQLVLSFAAARGHRDAGENPAAWERLRHVLPAPTKLARVVQHAAMPFADVPALMAALAGREDVAARALQFLILTAARSGEVLAATWDEIDLDNAVWTVPATRMKAGKEHRVPLAPQAIELLRSLPTEAGNPFLFLGPRGQALTSSTFLRALKAAGSDVTLHGFRSSFADWAHERTGTAGIVIELALAHSVGDKVEQAYRRGDLFNKRRRLMEQWSAFCTSPAKPAKGNNVVVLGGGRP